MSNYSGTITLLCKAVISPNNQFIMLSSNNYLKHSLASVLSKMMSQLLATKTTTILNTWHYYYCHRFRALRNRYGPLLVSHEQRSVLACSFQFPQIYIFSNGSTYLTYEVHRVGLLMDRQLMRAAALPQRCCRSQAGSN